MLVRAMVWARAKVKVAEPMSTATGRAMRLHFWLSSSTITTSTDSHKDDGGNDGCSP